MTGSLFFWKWFATIPTKKFAQKKIQNMLKIPHGPFSLTVFWRPKARIA